MFRNAEYPFNALGVANAYLDVSFLEEAGPLIDWSALKEDSANRIDRCVICLFPNIVQQRDNSAIEVSSK